MKMRREDLGISGGRRLYLYSFDDTEELHRRMASLWGTASEGWRTRAETVERWFEPVTRALLEAVGAGPGRLLDLGCGAQTMPVPGGWEKVGLDLARPMLDPGARAVVGACNPLPFRDGAFDAAVSRFALMFASDPACAFREVGRVLKEGGRLAFAVWGPEGACPASDAAQEEVSRRLGLRAPEPDEPHANRLGDAAETRAMLEAGGLEVEALEEVSVDYLATVSNEEAVDSFVALAGPVRTALERMGEEERLEALAEIAERFRGCDLTAVAHVWRASARKRGA